MNPSSAAASALLLMSAMEGEREILRHAFLSSVLPSLQGGRDALAFFSSVCGATMVRSEVVNYNIKRTRQKVIIVADITNIVL